MWGHSLAFRRRPRRPRPKPLIERRLGGVGRGIQEFGRQARPREEIFSREQETLRSMFGGGEGTFWGLEDSTTGVQINHDLNPRRGITADYGTADIFFGGNPSNQINDFDGETRRMFGF